MTPPLLPAGNPIPMTHHPDCLFWFEQYPVECTCGLTGPARGKLKPWTQEHWNEWRDGVLRNQRSLDL